MGELERLFQVLVQEKLTSVVMAGQVKHKLLFDKDIKIDKKMVIWEKVASLEPQIVWLYTRNQTLKKESFDMTDAYTCVLGHMREKGIWS